MNTAQPNHQTLKLLWYNTFLLHGFSIGSKHQFGAKPHLKTRATELGIRLQKLTESAQIHPDADIKNIFALCEVFSPKTFALIYEQLDPQNTRYAIGPQSGLSQLSTKPTNLPRWMQNISKLSRRRLPVSSGLCTLTTGLPITRIRSEPFRLVSTPSPNKSHDWNMLNRGHPLRDPDFWANKGILLTEIDLGPGKIELYSTHLFSGQVIGEALYTTLRRVQKLHRSGALPLPSPFKKPLEILLNASITAKISNYLNHYQDYFDLHPALRLKIQRAQLEQLVEFIIRHHNPKNTIILAGDFNLDAHDPQAIAELEHAISRLKQSGITLHDTRHAFPNDQHANSTLISNELLFHTYLPEQLVQATTNPRPTQWLDYIFVQQEEAQHTCSIEILEQALRPFPRQSAPNQPMHFLSDHIGLELTLRASPKPS